MITLKIFVSSPGDVGTERGICQRVFNRMELEFRGLVHLEPLEGLAAEIIKVDEDLNGMPFSAQIHILDAEQGEALAAIFREGMEHRARELEALEQREFYLEKFFRAPSR